MPGIMGRSDGNENVSGGHLAFRAMNTVRKPMLRAAGYNQSEVVVAVVHEHETYGVPDSRYDKAVFISILWRIADAGKTYSCQASEECILQY